MSLVKRAVDVEPVRAYKTASKKERQRRLDHSFGVIERRLAARISSFASARNLLKSIGSDVSSEIRVLDKWDEAHAGARRLPSRMDKTCDGVCLIRGAAM